MRLRTSRLAVSSQDQRLREKTVREREDIEAIYAAIQPGMKQGPSFGDNRGGGLCGAEFQLALKPEV